MDLSNVRMLSNRYQDVRLVSLKDWRRASEFVPRDQGGPYMVVQAGYDPTDPKAIPDEFVLGRHGRWVPLAIFFRLPKPTRRAEFVFGDAAEVIRLIEELPADASVLHGDDDLGADEEEHLDDLNTAFTVAKDQA